MSITGINSVNVTGRHASAEPDMLATAASASAATRSRDGVPAATLEIDQLTQQPVPPRFPWLSRLSLQLETASRQRATFPPAPALGDHLDHSA